MISAIVPFVDYDGSRTAAMEWVYRHSYGVMDDVETIMCQDDGQVPFNKSMAINAGVRQASHDILYIVDADTWVDPADVRAAAQMIEKGSHDYIQPWATKYKLNEKPTQRLMKTNDAIERHINYRQGELEYYGRYPYAPPLLVSRAAFEAVNGMDERFRGWGGEDTAFVCALRAFGFVGGARGKRALHLWHPRRRVTGNDQWYGEDTAYNYRPREDAYKKAQRDRRAMELLIEGNRP